MTKKYRKKPVEIEAVQWRGDNISELMEMNGFDNVHTYFEGNLAIKTLEGMMHASIGDYIIKGVRGEFYPCKPDIFEQTYETANPSEVLIADIDSMPPEVTEEAVKEYCRKRSLCVVDSELLKKYASAHQERKKGKWIRITQGAMPEKYICPFCHRTVKYYGVEKLLTMRYPYCHCGADMRQV